MRMHEAQDQEVGCDRDGQHEIVVLQLGAQHQASDTRQSNRHRWNVGQRQWPLRQFDPIECDQADDFGKGNRHDDEIRAANAKRQPPDEIAARSRNHDRQREARDWRPGIVNDAEAAGKADIETKRGERADIGADAEERDVTEAELAGEAKQQVEAHRPDDEDAGRDQRVHEIGIVQPQRHRCEGCDGQNGARRIHPTRSLRANNPVGLKIRTAMMIRKPIASR